MTVDDDHRGGAGQPLRGCDNRTAGTGHGRNPRRVDGRGAGPPVLEAGRSLGVDPTRVGLAGDSAGGNLVAAVALGYRGGAGPDLRAQLLEYPAVDAEMTSGSFDENAEGPFLTKDEMAWFYRHYRMDSDPQDWRLSPIHAHDFSGLPPTLVVTTELDSLRDAGEAYADRLANAGIRATAVRYAGVTHGFFG